MLYLIIILHHLSLYFLMFDILSVKDINELVILYFQQLWF